MPLVLTSGNVSDEPIAFEDADALDRLAPIADRFLVHDRPIATRTDDSVVRVVASAPLLMRRSRGYVPASLDLPLATTRHAARHAAPSRRTRSASPRTIARGASHHIGDIKNFETLTSLRDGVAHFEALFEVSPEVVAHDLHPDYLSTRYAQERVSSKVERASSSSASSTITPISRRRLPSTASSGPAVGAIYDGTGYGTDGTIWGGEMLSGGLRGSSAPAGSPASGCPAASARSASRGGWACSWLTR